MKGLIFFLLILFWQTAGAQQTDTIRTFRFGDPARSGVFEFPDVPGRTYEKIKMLYRMRCKNGLVSTTANRNLGCGEWDYSCNTYLTDSSQTDSARAIQITPVISGFSGSSYTYSQLPTYRYIRRIQRLPGVPGNGPDTLTSLGEGTASLPLLFDGNRSAGRWQKLLTQAELTAAGLAAGAIRGLALDFTQAGQPIRNLRVRIRATSQSQLLLPETGTGFTEVLFRDSPVAGTGSLRLPFHQAFLWNGTDNLIVDISYSQPVPGGSGNQVRGAQTGTLAPITNLKDDRFAELDGLTGRIDAGDIDSLDNATRFTFEAWVYMTAWANWAGIFKDNGKTVLETGDQPGQLYAIIRNPSNTYGFASNVLPLNTWTHVAMVFDGAQTGNAGRLKLYVNGVQRTLTFSGTIPNRTENNNTPLVLGGGVPCRLDDARIWSSALSAATIQSWYRQAIKPEHPDFSRLEAAYSLDEAAGNLCSDASPNNRTATLTGTAIRRMHPAHELFKNMEPVSEWPALTLLRMPAPGPPAEVPVTDSLVNLPRTMIRYALTGGQPAATDTTQIFEGQPQPVYDESGALTGTRPVPAPQTITTQNLDYYRKTPQKIELLSFVTPYGIGIDFGMGGKMWEFDMTDFAPVLKGKKRLSMERGGENQEEMDVRFVFIEGTPARKALAVQQIWPVSHSAYADIAADRVYEARTLSLLPGAQSFKIRSAITGHGQEGEFIPRTHTLNLNGGTPEYVWDVWSECGSNPVYPQGGTWVYDRAGWCPGAPTDLQEWNPAASFSLAIPPVIDYSVSIAGGDSRYIASHQLVQYGPAAHVLDAALEEIQNPGDRSEYGRFNPACMNPRVKIRNTGSTVLTSLQLEYGLEGGNSQTTTWTGNLAFMAAVWVELPLENLGPAGGTFRVTCSSPNGSPDAYAPNNTIRSPYAVPLVVPAGLIVEVKANLRPQETEWSLQSHTGDWVGQRSDFTGNTIHRDTLQLAPGCYAFLLTDAGGDGLNWWANTAQGTGYCRLRNAATGALVRSFNADFGNEISQQILVTATTGTADRPVPAWLEIGLWPNPVRDGTVLDLVQDHAGELEVEIRDVLGRQVFSVTRHFEGSDVIALPSGSLPRGTYQIRVRKGTSQRTLRFIRE